MGPQAPVHPGVAVAGGVAEGEAARRAVLLGGLGEFQEFVRGRGELREARLLERRDAIVHEGAGIADRNIDPLGAAALAVSDRARHPAAVFLSEIVGDVGDVHALLREQMRQGVKPPEQVWAGAGVGRDRGLGLHVLIGFPRYRHLHAGGPGEGFQQLEEFVVFRLHEIFPPQHRELCALLRLPRRGLRPCLGPFQEGGGNQCAGRRECRAAWTRCVAKSRSWFPPAFPSRTFTAAPAARPSSGRTDGRGVGRALAARCRRA